MEESKDDNLVVSDDSKARKSLNTKESNVGRESQSKLGT